MVKTTKAASMRSGILKNKTMDIAAIMAITQMVL
jgi:hypothetical protein